MLKTAVPKDKPVKSPEFLKAFKGLVTWCEYPGSSACHGDLETAHIRARGMGGGRRKDTPGNLLRLCHYHHAYYDTYMGQSHRHQQYMISQGVVKRSEVLKQQLDEVFAKSRKER